MNPAERIRATIRFQEVDRPPVIPELVAVTATLAGASPRDYVRSGEVIAQCQLEAQRRIGHDVVFASADLCIEAEAIGCETSFPDDNYPSVKSVVVRESSDVKKLKIPDPRSDGRMPELLKAVRTLKEETDGAIPVIASLAGPMTIASRIMDIEKMLYMLVDHPDHYREILRFCQQTATEFARALVKEGADGILMFDPTVSPFVIPARIFKEFELNAVRDIFNGLKRINPEIITWYSVAGPLQKNTAILTSLAADITTVDYVTPIETAMKHCGSTVINGNIKPALFLDGSEEDILRESKELLSATRSMERFILGSGCEIPLHSSMENIAALVRAAEEWASSFDYSGRPMLTAQEITIFPQRKKIFASPGENLLDAIHKANIGITSYCDKSGSCGKCVIKVKKGETEPPERIEALQLQNKGSAPDERLACRVKVNGPMEVYIPYYSRIFQNHMAVSEELFKKSIKEELAPYGLGPNMASEKLDLASLTNENPSSYEEWVAKKLDLREIDSQVVGRLASVIQEGAGETRAIIDKGRGEVVDFTRSEKLYGMAVDIGTTTISAYVHDLRNGELLCVGSIENPQTRWGLDVITRATRIAQDPALLPKMQNNLIEGINRLISFFHRDHAIPNNRIYEMIVVGNPVIAHMFLGLSPEPLSHAPFVPTVSRWVSTFARNLRARAELAVNPGCRINIPPSVGGFVGADTVAGMLATGMHERDELSLFIDIGTNGEIVIGNRKGLICASVAAGPAFESAHLSHGRMSQHGIINKVMLTDSGEVLYETIGGAAPFGLCGSGVIDALAEFTRHGIINSRGAFTDNGRWPQLKGDVFILAPKQKTATFSPISISRKDIEEAQKAKSALQTGVSLIIREMGVKPEDIRKVYISGSFGIYIDIDNAKAIGMIPDFPWAKFEYIKNSAGIGARLILLSGKARESAKKIPSMTRHINLVNQADFINLFIDHMHFPSPAPAK